jgi:DNA repair exonuclease SbcCD ATPase subunit
MGQSNGGELLLKYNEAQEEIEKINAALPGYQQNLNKIQKIVKDVKSKQDEFRKSRLRTVEILDASKRALSNCRADIQSQEKTIRSFEEQKDTQCPRCLGTVDEQNYAAVVEEARQTIARRKAEEEKILASATAAEKELADIKTNEASMEKALLAAEAKSAEFTDKVNAGHRRLAELAKVQKPEASTDQRLIQEQIAELKNQAIAKDNEAKGSTPYAEILKDAEAEVDERAMACKVRKDELSVVEAELPYYEFWVKAFGDSGIRKFVVDGIIPALNARIDYWLQFLIDGKIKLTFDNELNEVIENNPPDGDPFLYYAMSGGERRRLNLAVSQAFAYVMMLNSGASLSLVFLDEVTSNIDPQGVEGVYNMIQEMAKDKQVFVTTHDHDLLDVLAGCKSINLVREGGFTTVVG